MLDGEAAFVRKVQAGEAAPRLLMLVGGKERDMPKPPPGGLTSAQTLARRRAKALVDDARSLTDRLAAATSPELAVYQSLEGEDHHTIIGAALCRAVAFALRW